MITDTLENTDLYRAIHPGVAAAFEYLKRTNFEKTADGRYDLVEGRLFAMVQRYATRRPNEIIWEAHRNFIDVQYVADGAERLGHLPAIEKPAVKLPYDESRDVEFYQVVGENLTLTALPRGRFVVLFPHDIHAPGIAWECEPTPVQKIVVKVAVNW